MSEDTQVAFGGEASTWSKADVDPQAFPVASVKQWKEKRKMMLRIVEHRGPFFPFQATAFQRLSVNMREREATPSSRRTSWETHIWLGARPFLQFPVLHVHFVHRLS